MKWYELLSRLRTIYMLQYPPLIRWFKLWQFKDRVFITDLEYVELSMEALRGFLTFWRRYVLPNLMYRSEVFDCDDFSIYLKAKAYEYFDFQVNSFGLAYGWLCYGNDCGYHMWNVAVTDVGVVFVEPQLGEALRYKRNGTLKIVSDDGFTYTLDGVII